MKNKIFLLLIFLSSCNVFKDSSELQKKLQPTWQDFFKNNYEDNKVIKVYIATNRSEKSTEFGCEDKNFGVEFSDQLKYGVCNVSVPKARNIGAINNGKEKNISSNFVITDSKKLDKEDFFKSLKNNYSPLVFIHGFNVKYNEAVIRASQLAYDLKYQGPIILFTWPSGSKDGFFDETLLNKTYENNSNSAKASIHELENFFNNLSKNNIRINLIVHSMGHQIAIPAIQKFANNNSKQLINDLFLNAPDYEIKGFRESVKDIKKITNKITLYCSNNDKAITASKIFNNNDRIGSCFNVDDVDVINVSAIDDQTLSLGHGYYSSRPILNDIFLALIGIETKHRLFIYKSELFSSEKYFLRK